MKENNQNHALALLADNNYLEYTKQMFYSARRYGNWRDELLLIAFEIPDDERLQWFRERNIKIEHISRNEFDFQNIPDDKAVFFAKLHLFKPRYNRYRKIIFLDTDMIIRKDINKLKEFNSFAAADDCFQYPLIHQLSRPGKPYEDAEINEHYSQDTLKKISFNTGVMVIPTEHNNEEHYQKLVQLTDKFGMQSVFFDQGVLNLHFIHSRKRIPYVYNDYYASEYFNRRGLLRRFNDRDAVILHIIHPCKPWDERCTYHGEWKRRLHAALTEKMPRPGGVAPTKFSVWKVDLINSLSIKEIYFKGAVVKFVRYNLWRVGQFLRKHSPLGRIKNNKP